MMDIGTFIQTLANSMVASSIYALVAVGLALAFGVMKMANFAHGEFLMVGAYCVYVLYSLMGLPFPVAVVLAIPVGALLGLVTERIIFRPTRKNVLAGFMATAGLALILQVVAGRVWGVGMAKSISTPYMGMVEIGGVSLGWQRVIIVPCAFVLLFALRHFLYHTKPGRALRACAQDPEIAALQGVKINRMTALAMALAGAISAFAGALIAPIHTVTPYMGHGVVLIAFIVVIFGGMASIEGAIVAAVILGFVHTFVTTLSDNLIASMVGVAIMAITLIVRPQGLFGSEKS
jgi:branched-chain amino acid transport system permease protein